MKQGQGSVETLKYQGWARCFTKTYEQENGEVAKPYVRAPNAMGVTKIIGPRANDETVLSSINTEHAKE
jgi:hypothetical protein